MLQRMRSQKKNTLRQMMEAYATSLLNGQFIDPLDRLRGPSSMGGTVRTRSSHSCEQPPTNRALPQGLQPKRASKASVASAAPSETPEERLQRLMNNRDSTDPNPSTRASPPSSPRATARPPAVRDGVAPTQLVKYRIVADRARPRLALAHDSAPLDPDSTCRKCTRRACCSASPVQLAMCCRALDTRQ
jgi:hypothetical protein